MFTGVRFEMQNNRTTAKVSFARKPAFSFSELT